MVVAASLLAWPIRAEETASFLWGNDYYSFAAEGMQDQDLSNRFEVSWGDDDRRLLVGHDTYTPVAIQVPFLIKEDRPYAGYLHVDHTWIGVPDLTLSVGYVGPKAYAGEMQEGWHETINNPRPAGWGNQLPSELTAFVRAAGEKLQPVSEDVLMRVYGEASAGTPKTGTGLGLEFRTAGRTFVYAGGRGEGVIYDLFVDGTVFSESHSVRRSPLRATRYWGVSWEFDGWRLRYEYEKSTRDFSSQVEEHEFGFIQVEVDL